MFSIALLLAVLGCSGSAVLGVAEPRASCRAEYAAPRPCGSVELLRFAEEAGARFESEAESRSGSEQRAELPALRFDHYHSSEEIALRFAALEREYPGWFRARALGRSVEGRTLPLLEIGERRRDGRASGEALRESADAPRAPALWVDGAIHGGELESSEVVLRVAEEVRRLVAAGGAPGHLGATRIYLAPVLNPDGRARALADPPRPGRLNAAGEGIDLNRDFPARWSAAKARASGPPQPETEAVMSFWREHPEIALAVSFHTSTSGFLAPPLPMSAEVRTRYDQLAARYEARLGLPRLAVPSHARGTTMDWFFAARGCVAFTLEIEGAHRPDAPPEERSVERMRAFLGAELEALTRAHAGLLLDLAAELARGSGAAPSHEQGRSRSARSATGARQLAP